MNNFYVYIYLDPRKPGKYEYDNYCFLYEPFYIGKGIRKRINEKFGRSKHFINKINKIKKYKLKPIVFKLKINLNEKKSFLLEIKLIKLIGRKDLNKGSLINFTDGGEGISGYKFDKKIREIIDSKHRKYFQDIKKEFEGRGYKLLINENEYKNSKQKLKCVCPNNHKLFISWNDFQQGGNCNCFRRTKFEDIKLGFYNRDYMLLIKCNEYKNAHQRLKYKCLKCGKYGLISWSNINRNKANCLCRKQITFYKNIKEKFLVKNFELLTPCDEYKNAHQKLKYRCKICFIENTVTWNTFNNGFKNKCICQQKNKNMENTKYNGENNVVS